MNRPNCPCCYSREITWPVRDEFTKNPGWFVKCLACGYRWRQAR